MRTLNDVRDVQMVLAKALPPNIAAIEHVFPGVGGRHGILFCYGTTIYNPSGVTVPLELIAHEAVHSQQQGLTPDQWWHEYLLSPLFRYGQELEAHRVELEQYREISNRAFYRRYRAATAERLAGPLYGNLTKKRVALAALTEAA